MDSDSLLTAGVYDAALRVDADADPPEFEASASRAACEDLSPAFVEAIEAARDALLELFTCESVLDRGIGVRKLTTLGNDRARDDAVGNR
jgi:hypothetical protein